MTLRVLHWDDELDKEHLSRLIERLNEKASLEVVTESDRARAFEMFTESAWDMIILDVEDGTEDLAGLDLAKRCREHRPEIPVLFLTKAENLILNGQLRLAPPAIAKSKNLTTSMLTLEIFDFISREVMRFHPHRAAVLHDGSKSAVDLSAMVVEEVRRFGVDDITGVSSASEPTTVREGLYGKGAVVGVVGEESGPERRTEFSYCMGMLAGLLAGQSSRLVLLTASDDPLPAQRHLSSLAPIRIRPDQDALGEEFFERLRRAGLRPRSKSET